MKLRKLVLISIAVTFAIVGIGTGLIAFNQWSLHHKFMFHSPIEVKTFRPFWVEKVTPQNEALVKYIETIPEPKDLVDDVDKYIYKVFGIEHYRMAIAVSKCEGYNHPADGFNTNTNGSIDVGKMRINSVNFKLPGCSLLEVATVKGNIDCGYKIWDRADGSEGDGKGDFSPWVGYTNGCALTKYE